MAFGILWFGIRHFTVCGQSPALGDFMRINANARTWNTLGLLLFGGMVTAIFWEVLPWFLAFVAPDAMPFFPFSNRTVTLENLLATGGEFTPHHLYWLIFHPLLANKLNYIVDTLMLTLAGVYYLRGRGSSHPTAWIGGLALGFSGYTFSLLSAGHRGHFDMFACVVFAFGLLVRCFRGRHWFHFAMLGACVAWGVTYQADLLVFLGMLIGAYVLWLTFARCADQETPVRRMLHVWPRFLLTAAVGACIAWPGVRVVIAQQMTGRTDQIASALGTTAASAADAAAKKQGQWIFATNWSLPPEDVAEFIVPGIFGNDSFQPPYPYWGRLGQPFGWEPGQRVMPNYRQHTVYLGALSVCFALFAVLLWWRTRRLRANRAAGQRSYNLSAVEMGRSAAPQRDSFAAEVGGSALPLPDDPLADVPFWLGAGTVCLLFSMGRYTPAYRIIYAVPYLDLIRCPVKIHHLVEICTAFLCGLGVEMWWRGAAGEDAHFMPASGRLRAPGPAPLQVKKQAVLDAQTGGRRASAAVSIVCRWMTILTAVLAGALLITAGIVSASGTEIAAHIARLGLGGYGEKLAGYTVDNLVRAACVFGVAALLFGLVRPRVGRDRPAVWLLAVLALVLAVDLATVAQRFVRPIDMQPFYADNVVSDTAVARGGIGAGVANYVTARGQLGDWFANGLTWHGLRSALDADANDKEKTAVMQALANRPEILWRATHARFVIAPWKAAAPLVKGQVLEPLVSFVIGQGTVRQAQPSMETCVLAAFTGALPAVYVVDGWQGGLSRTTQVQRMSAADWDPAQTTLCDAPGSIGGVNRMIGQAQVVQRRGADFCLTTIMDVNTPHSGLVVLDEKYADDLLARVDGREVTVHCANALWAAIEVPEGRHEVTIRRRPHALPMLLSGGVGLLVGGWGLARVLLGLRRRKNEQTA